jgi:hypothetical protein
MFQLSREYMIQIQRWMNTSLCKMNTISSQDESTYLQDKESMMRRYFHQMKMTMTKSRLLKNERE